eukprot:gene20918-22972_t
MEEEFPKLASQLGAIEVLRTTSGGGGSRPLIIVPIGPQRYTIRDLKSSFGGATLYVRPMQHNLDETVVRMPSTALEVNWLHCNQKMQLDNLRVHQESCGNANSFDDEAAFTDDAHYGAAANDRRQIPSFDNEPHQSTSEPIDPCCSSSSNSQQEVVAVLQEVFPAIEMEQLISVANSSGSINAAIEVPVNEDRKPDAEDHSLTAITRAYKSAMTDDEIHLSVERDQIWITGLAFYKKSANDLHRLTKKLTVSFEGEAGLDAGAISAEIFMLLLHQLKKRLFIGATEQVIPIKDRSKLPLFRLAGVIVVYSIKLGGPAFPCLNPRVYYYIAGKRENLQACLQVDDLPLTASTEAHHAFISNLNACVSSEDIESCLENDTNCSIMSLSHWPSEVPITLSNKDSLIANIIEHEIVWSRQQEIDEFCKGLGILGLLRIIREHTEQCKEMLFFNKELEIDVAKFQNLLEKASQDEGSFAEQQAYAWLIEFSSENKKSDDYPGEAVQQDDGCCIEM